MTKMRIMFFNYSHFSIGRGGENWISEVIKYLSNKGHKVKLVTTDCCAVNMDIKTDFDYTVIKSRKLALLNLYNFQEFQKEISNADVLYYFNSFVGSQLPIIWFRILRKLPKVIVGYHSKLDRSLLERIYYDYFIIPYLKRLDAHHVLSTYHYEKLKREGFKNVYLIPNFVDTQLFSCSEKDSSVFTILAPGVVSEEKGIDILIDVARLLKDDNVKFLITGRLTDPIYKEKIALMNNIEYIGYLNRGEYVKVISSAHLILLPTRSETFSLVILESLSSCTPVVSTNLPELTSIYGNTEFVKLVDIDPIKMAQNVKSLYELWVKDNEAYRKLGMEARQYILTKFDKEKILPKIENLFEKVYKGKKE